MIAGVAVLKFVVTVLQFAIRFEALTEPSPVAKSYPAVVVHPGVVELNGGFGVAGSTRMPKAPAVLLLQLGEPPAHSTELLPFVTSLNVQFALITPGPSDELQALVPGDVPCAVASLYKT